MQVSANLIYLHIYSPQPFDADQCRACADAPIQGASDPFGPAAKRVERSRADHLSFPILGPCALVQEQTAPLAVSRLAALFLGQGRWFFGVRALVFLGKGAGASIDPLLSKTPFAPLRAAPPSPIIYLKLERSRPSKKAPL